MWPRIIAAVFLCLLFTGCRQQAAPDSVLLRETTAVSPTATPSNCAPSPDLRQFPVAPWPNTDFCQHSFSYQEFRFGGVARDRIAAIDQPAVETIAQADTWLTAQEPVLILQLDDAVRAYPLSILLWHEIVNDELNGRFRSAGRITAGATARPRAVLVCLGCLASQHSTLPAWPVKPQLSQSDVITAESNTSPLSKQTTAMLSKARPSNS